MEFLFLFIYNENRKGTFGVDWVLQVIFDLKTAATKAYTKETAHMLNTHSGTPVVCASTVFCKSN